MQCREMRLGGSNLAGTPARRFRALRSPTAGRAGADARTRSPSDVEGRRLHALVWANRGLNAVLCDARYPANGRAPALADRLVIARRLARGPRHHGHAFHAPDVPRHRNGIRLRRTKNTSDKVPTHYQMFSPAVEMNALLGSNTNVTDYHYLSHQYKNNVLSPTRLFPFYRCTIKR